MPSIPKEIRVGDPPAPKAEMKRAESAITESPARMGGLMPTRSEIRSARGEDREGDDPWRQDQPGRPRREPVDLDDENRDEQELCSLEKGGVTSLQTPRR